MQGVLHAVISKGIMTSLSAKEALEPYAISSSPAVCIVNYGKRHEAKTEQGNSGIPRSQESIGSVSSRIKHSKLPEENRASWAIRSHSTDESKTGGKQ